MPGALELLWMRLWLFCFCARHARDTRDAEARGPVPLASVDRRSENDAAPSRCRRAEIRRPTRYEYAIVSFSHGF